MHSKDSFICDGCNKIIFGKPKHKITIFGLDNASYSRFYCSDECLTKSEDFEV